MTNPPPHEELKQIDFFHVWHPFTQHAMWFNEEPLIIERGEGVELIDTKGARYLDGVSSLWCNVHGHGVDKLVSELKAQVDTLCHSTMLGLSHVPILELTKRLMQIVPSNLSRVFYADSGTTAVEAGLRMALEWWQKQDSALAKKKQKLVSLEGGYHGDTLGSVGVGFLGSFHRHLQSVVVPAKRVPPPHLFRFNEGLSEEEALSESIGAVSKLFERESEEIAALICEPLVQGAAGIWIQPVEYLKELSRLCREHQVLLIVDEVATGFGKTGRMFAVEHAGIEPDIMILGKGLSAGYLPISATLATEEIFEGFLGALDSQKTFYYGQTYGGNPLAARVSAANLDLFVESGVLDQIPSRIEHFHQELSEKISPLAHVDEVRSFGFMIGIELTKTPGKREPYPASAKAGGQIVMEARKLGAIIRPLGNVIVLMPPICMNKEQLSSLVNITAKAIEKSLG